MAEARLERLTVGEGAAAREIAVLVRSGATPGIFWLGGFKSDMAGTKAEALDRFAETTGRAATRFDYSGHGRSGGRFEDGTISRWLEEAEVVLDRCAPGPQIVVGSSMGGWLALLLAQRLKARGETARLAGIVLIAPAVDMTKALMWDAYGEAAQQAIREKGFYAQPSAYSEEPYRVTRALIDDGERHLFGDGPIETGCPVHVIQGMQDDEVPWAHATRLMEKLAFDDAVLTLVRDGDHRLSRPEDIERLIRAVEEMAMSPEQLTLPFEDPVGSPGEAERNPGS
jgi:pimeloyl-ACP methyl ester carboxylesterase